MEYRVFFDITVSRVFYVCAENEQKACESAREMFKKDPYAYTKNFDTVVSGDVVDVEEC